MLQCLEATRVTQLPELLAKAVQVTEDTVVDEAHQAVQLQQRVLQRGGSEQDLGSVRQRVEQRARRLVVGLVDVAQAMRFVDHHQVPRHALHCVRLASGELVGANDDPVRTRTHGRCGVEGVRYTILDRLSERLGLKDRGGQAELVCQLLMPLLAQIGRHDDEDVTLALGPALCDQQASLNGLTQAHLVGQDHAFREWIPRGE